MGSETKEELVTPNMLMEYRERLSMFDAVVCEAVAVNQASAGRKELPTVGLSTHVFARMCSHAQALICAAPKSRWLRREYEMWDISHIAPHARSIMEGYLLFRYLTDAPQDDDSQRIYTQTMHLYDCTKRKELLKGIVPDEEIDQFEEQSIIIKSRIESTAYFKSMAPQERGRILSGQHMMVYDKQSILARLGFEKDKFNMQYNYLSQYTHMLSFTFYRIEPNGRGTGLLNAFDIAAIGTALEISTSFLREAVIKTVELFPDVENVRQGIDSKFSPGPHRNLPKHKKRALRKL